MIVLGISALFHDSAAALVIDGRVVSAAQQERFSRKKHDAAIPTDAVNWCLQDAGLHIDDVDYVVFYEKPFRKFERILTTSLRTFPRGMGQFVGAMGVWLGSRLWLESKLARALDVDPERILFSDHHLSHAASAYFTSPFEDAAVLTMDGVGEWNTAAIYHGISDDSGSRLEPVVEQHFPHSMGLLYSAITAYLGFRVNNGEYKVMGLASYGEPRYLDAFAKLCTISEQGSVVVNMRYFCFDRHTQKSFTPALEALLGTARPPGSELDPTEGDSRGETQRWIDIAATLQAVCETQVLAAARYARQLTGARHLCLAGGVALNCVANEKIAKKAGFDSVYVHPAAGDAGGALGAALLVSHQILGEPRQQPGTFLPFLGQAFDGDAADSFLADCRFRYVRMDDEAALVEEVARRLADGQVCGWLQGRAEWGPRALGNRSILADPRSAKMTARVNASIKFRESFRPFAPVVLKDEAERWFDLHPAQAHLTPWMLSTVPVKAEGRAVLGAVTHVNGSARVQVVDAGINPRLTALLQAFRAQTGVGCLLNTSFNLKGEPICNTPGEAYSVFDRSGLDFLVVEDCIVARTNAPARAISTLAEPDDTTLKGAA